MDTDVMTALPKSNLGVGRTHHGDMISANSGTASAHYHLVIIEPRLLYVSKPAGHVKAVALNEDSLDWFGPGQARATWPAKTCKITAR